MDGIMWFLSLIVAITVGFIGYAIYDIVQQDNSYRNWKNTCLSVEGQHVIKTGETTQYIMIGKVLTPVTTDHYACTNASGTISTKDN